MKRQLSQFRKIRKKKYAKYFYILFLLFILLYLAFNISSTTQIISLFKPVPLSTEINPNFLTQVNDCFILTASVYGYTLRITTGFRSISDQTQLYDQGRTINGHIVTEAEPGHSLHNYGYAVDVADKYKGYNINWTRLVKIANYCSLESGGVGDLPHFEERAGLSTDQFATGLRPPLLTLPCPIMAERIASSSPLTLKDLKGCGAPKF
jgi:peptidoglycan L-alanyl-D-glutamate endopeptidase CwlK